MPYSKFAPANGHALPSSEFRGQDDERERIKAPAILQYWQIAVRWKLVIIGIVITCLVGGLVVTLLMTPKYTATSRLEISREQKKVTGVAGLESDEVGREFEFYQTQYSLLEARSLAERVARDQNLALNDAFFAAHGESADGGSFFQDRRGLPLGVAERQERERRAVKLLLKNISISPVRGSSLVDISYTSSSSALSARIVNSWAAQFIASSIDRRFSSTADARKFLEGRLAELRTRLQQSESDLVRYAAQKNIVTLAKSEDPNGKTRTERTLVSDDLEALNKALAQATADRIAAESRAKVATPGGANEEALNNQAIAQLRQKRAELAADYAKLLVQFEPGYPAARALKEQINALDASMAREEGRVRSAVSLQYAAALKREQGLQTRVDELKNRLGAQQRDSIRYNIYQREADTNRELYDGLLQRYKEIGVAGVGANNIAVVDVAKAPDEPSAPSLPLNLVLSLLLGLGTAAAATFALEQIDEGLREPGQVGEDLHIPLLGSVPDVEDDDVLEQLRDAKSTISEAYLAIRTNLAFSTDAGVPRSLMITSTRQAEGKSTTSFALATVLARTGKTVLIMDADMRSPSIHQYAGGANENGLSNFLAGDNAWEPLVQGTEFAGLAMMSAGQMPPSAAELLSTERLGALVEQLLGKFDHVIIDSPPILGLADAPLISRFVQGCVFVIEAEGVAVRGVQMAIERLRSVHATVLGGVLTKLKSRQAGHGYGYDYGYGYGDDADRKA